MKGLAAAALLAATTPAIAQEHVGHTDQAAPKTATLLEGYGHGGWPVRTSNPQAQAFFDNGMQLGAAFAHKAAIEAMEESVRLDPACVSCAWGLAWAAGPTINYDVEGEDLKAAQGFAARADKLARASGTALERSLTAALVKRYRNGDKMAFARAMETIASANPASDPLTVLAADAWLQSADFEDEKAAKAASAHSAALLERVLARNPTYTPAIHFYIHATEIAGFGAKAEPYADRLGALAPRSQHLVHMPSHTFYWVGRYADAARVNRQAVEISIAQAEAMGGNPPEGVFGLPYHAHNVTFGLGGALMAGDSETALWLARPLIEKSTAETEASPFGQSLAGSAYVAVSLFEAPEQVLKIEPPRLPYLVGMWHYARAEAWGRLGDLRRLKMERDAIVAPPNQDKKDRSWHGAQTMHIAKAVLDGRAAAMEGRHAEAITAFQRGAELQEQPAYSQAADPPLWWFPVRRQLAEAKLAAGDEAGARTEAEATLKVRPKDPGALALLAKLDGAIAAR